MLLVTGNDRTGFLSTAWLFLFWWHGAQCIAQQVMQQRFGLFGWLYLAPVAHGAAQLLVAAALAIAHYQFFYKQAGNAIFVQLYAAHGINGFRVGVVDVGRAVLWRTCVLYKRSGLHSDRVCSCPSAP